jgi:hypothetical protein
MRRDALQWPAIDPRPSVPSAIALASASPPRFYPRLHRITNRKICTRIRGFQVGVVRHRLRLLAPMHSCSSTGISTVVSCTKMLRCLPLLAEVLEQQGFGWHERAAVFHLRRARASAAHSAGIEILRSGGSRFCDESTSGSLGKLNTIK